MKVTFIKNGSVVTQNGVEIKTVVLQDGVIINDNFVGAIPEGAEIIDAAGMYVAPGFVELHAHGGGGYDFMDATEEAFDGVLKAHLAHGTTSFMPTTVACDYEAMSGLFSLYRKMADKSSTALLGVHLEGPYISQSMRGAQNPRYVREPSKYETDRLMDEAGDIISMCTAAPEIGGVEYMAKKMRERDIVLSVGHSDGLYDDMIRAHAMGFERFTHLYSNSPSVHKVDQVVCAGVREAAYMLEDMSIELIGDGHHLPKEVLGLALKVKGVDKITLTTDAMRAAGCVGLTESYLGEIKPENRVIIEDGVAKLPDRTYYAGSIATSDVALRWAVNECGVPLGDAFKLLSLNPARIARADKHKGSITVGKDADILLLDKELNIKKVLTKGIVRI